MSGTCVCRTCTAHLCSVERVSVHLRALLTVIVQISVCPDPRIGLTAHGALGSICEQERSRIELLIIGHFIFSQTAQM